MNARIRNWWPTIALIAYCAMLIDVIVFKAIPTIHIGHLRLKFSGTHTGPSNFIPFKTLAHQLIGQGNHLIAAVNILGNIGLFLPVGMLAPFVFRSMSWSRALALGMLTGLFCEALEVSFVSESSTWTT